MTDAPERIWAKIHGASTDVMSGQRGLLGAWHECQREGHVGYIRTDLVEAMEAENQRLRAALQRAYDHVLRDAPDWFMRHSHEQQALEVERSAALAALRSKEAGHG